LLDSKQVVGEQKRDAVQGSGELMKAEVPTAGSVELRAANVGREA